MKGQVCSRFSRAKLVRARLLKRENGMWSQCPKDYLADLGYTWETQLVEAGPCNPRTRE